MSKAHPAPQAQPAPPAAAGADPAPPAAAGAETDARLLNWRLVVPSEPDGLLLLAAAGETLPGAVCPARDAAGLAAALDGRSYPAVVVGDLGAWARLDGTGGAAALLGRAAAAVAPGGWLYAGFANRLYPAGLRDRGALRVAAARRALAAAGLEPVAAYLVFPDQRCPAYLVGTAGSAELDYFLRTLFFPHASASSALKARLEQRALTLARLAALATPPRLRPLFAPAYGLVTCRPHP
jgi:hypothetical protein